MALAISGGAPTMFLRRAASEEHDLSRSALDERFGLTPDEFRVDGDLVAIGPIYGGGEDAIGALVAELEAIGLVYFDDFFELSGNWPDWLRLLARG
jgi:hypothetical protein